MIILKLALAVVAATGWQSLPPAPITPEFNARTSVWTGKEMLVFGRDQQTALDSHGKPYATGALNVAAAYDPQARRWRKLSPPAKTSGFLGLASVWTGNEMLVWGQGTHLAYNPATDVWRRLPASRLLSVHDGFGAVVWTGKEMLGWGGGCCGDSFSDGVAPAPVRAAAAVRGGSRVFVTSASRNVFAYDPGKGRWQKLPLLPRGRVGSVAVWDGARLLVWGGARGGAALVPGAKSWTVFAHGPLPARLEPTAVWTGSSVLVWGGAPTKTWGTYSEAGAAYTPPVLGCGDDWMGENLVVTPKVKSAVRAAYVSAHRGVHVGAPLTGHTYYGMYSGTSYAIATFSASPTVFRTDALGRWRVRADTDGRICSNVLPVELAKVWSLRHERGSCYVLPR